MKKNFISILWTIAVVFPILFVWIGNVIVYSTKSKTYDFYEFIALLAQTIIGALPFVFLAILAKDKLKQSESYHFYSVLTASILVLCFEILLWSYYLYDSIFSTSRGVNMGLGMLMLFSPIISLLIIFICFVIGCYANILFCHLRKK